jgi:hypothetical protein
MNTLNVENIAQKILLDTELKGQLSDGRWENTQPYDHWQPWCAAEVVVNPDNLGTDFWANKRNYRFNSKDLLEIIGDRMVRKVRAALFLGVDKLDYAVSVVAETNGYGDVETYPYRAEYKRKTQSFLEETGVTEEAFFAALDNDTLYTMKHMRKDLSRLSKIFKIRRGQHAAEPVTAATL